MKDLIKGVKSRTKFVSFIRVIDYEVLNEFNVIFLDKKAHQAYLPSQKASQTKIFTLQFHVLKISSKK